MAYAICWITATEPEARGVRRLRDLDQLVCRKPFGVYRNQGGTEWVVKTGIGALSCAAGTGFLMGFFGEEDELAFVNVGIAGSQQGEIGAAYLVHKVIDVAENKSFFPGVTRFGRAATETCRTVTEPSSTYPEQGMYDMEGSAFFRMAKLRTDIDSISLIKVVSDTATRPFSELNLANVEPLILGAETLVNDVAEKILDAVKTVSERRQSPIGFQSMTKTFDFSVSERIQLEKLLRRWALLRPTENPSVVTAGFEKKEVLPYLTSTLDETPLEFPHD